MGLAASQARLLFLTSRQDDIGLKEMRISNQKMSLSRESSSISDAYTAALNQRKLTWVVDGTSITDQTTALTYDLLMKPNNSTKLGQYLVANSSNDKVVLDKFLHDCSWSYWNLRRSWRYRKPY